MYGKKQLPCFIGVNLKFTFLHKFGINLFLANQLEDFVFIDIFKGLNFISFMVSH